MEKIWNERRWWYRPSVIFMLVIGAACIVAAIIMAEGDPVKGTVITLLASGLGIMCFAGFVALTTDEKRTFRANKSLAIIDRETGRVLAAQLSKIRLVPWPFTSKYDVRQYPTLFRFTTKLSPITANPKVIPLFLSLTVTLADHESLPEWFLNFLNDCFLNGCKSTKGTFDREIFEILQHRLPQNISNNLNPFDASTIKQLEEYLGRELVASLPFQCNIKDLTVSMAA